MIKAMQHYERKELEDGFKAQREQILKLKSDYAALLFRTEQNRLDTALSASLRSTLHTLCRKAINKQQFKGIARAWLADE